MKNILLIGGSTGIGLALSKKLEDNYNVFISTRNPEKFSSSNIKTTKLDLDKDFEADWLPEVIDGFVYLPGTINLRPFKGLKSEVFIDDFNINVLGCIKILQKILNYKTALIKTGIFSAILACWGVILFGTFLTFK